MGVPAFFRWLCARNPKALVEVLENSDDNTLSLNPDVDNLYLDMNGIIHPCSHPEQGGIPVPVTYDDMFINVFHYIDRLLDIVRPKQLLYLAVDGVAPRAKMNQQRSIQYIQVGRRFRAAQESVRIQNEKQRLRDYWKTQGLNSDVLNTYIEKHFDSNQITPGTEYMQKLSIAIQYYIYDRMNNNPLLANVIVIFNDAAIPGEGEHKILQFIRDQRMQANYKTVRHCLYGADADLIMLGLSTHEPYFYVIRETIMANDDKQCSICQQKGHFFMDCPRRDKQIEDINAELKSYQQQQQSQPKNKIIQVDFQILQLSIVREFLHYETRDLQQSLNFQYDLERIIDDFVFMCFLVGNDFLPHIPCLKITEGGIDCLLIIYKSILNQAGDYLTNCGTLNLQQFNQFIFHVGLVEDELIRGQEKKKEIAKNRRERNQEFREQKVIQPPEISIVDTPNEVLYKFKSSLKERLNEINQQEMEQAQLAKSSQELKKWKALSVKQRYYMEKFGITPTQFSEFQHRIKVSYLEALAWTLKYYYQGCVDWGWFYPYHYAPFAQDLTNVDQVHFEFTLNKPFRAFQQLLAVLPPQSSQFLPRPYQQLMLESSSPIADFYPSDFVVDLKGKKFAWLGEVVLPFVDADRLIAASNINVNLSKCEQDRDKLGQTLIFSNKKIEKFSYDQTHLQVQVEWLARFPIGSDIKSPIPTMVNILNNQIISGTLINTVIERDTNFIQNRIINGTIMPPEFLDEYYMNQCEYNKRSFGGEVVRRIIGQILGFKQIRKPAEHDRDENQIMILSLFLGNRAANLGLTTQYLDHINTFQEEDPILHQMDAGRPRALYFGNNLEISQRINRTNMEKVKKEDIPVQIPEPEDTPHLQLLSQYLKGVQISPKQIFNYNRNFENENDIFLCINDEKQMELFSDYVQHELEKMNVCEGFELTVDCETVYGSIGLNMIDLLNDLQGSKSPKFVMAILDSGDEPNRIMNKVLTLTSYQQYANVLVPLEMKDLNLKLGNMEQQLSFLMSNITSPYKCIDDHVRMYDFCQRITPAPQNNIFNILVRVPTLQDTPEDSILNFKKNELQKVKQMIFQEPLVQFVSHYESFGESYFMRGLSPIPNDRTLNSYGIDIRLIDYVYLVPQEYEMQDTTLPFHSCLFSNECYKHSLHQLFNKFDKLKKSAYLQYEKSSLEDVQELKHGMQALIENYGGIDDVQQQ